MRELRKRFPQLIGARRCLVSIFIDEDDTKASLPIMTAEILSLDLKQAHDPRESDPPR
jgi:hypothetical protein